MRARTAILMAAAGFLLVRRLLRRHGRAEARQLIRYRVPTGQDPAAVLGRLRVAGVPAEPEVTDGESLVAISLPASASRDSLREILRDAPENMQGDPSGTEAVAFIEEP